MSKNYRFPGFLIAGVQRGGTSTLHGYLSDHPAIEASRHKEVHFFDHFYFKGPGWYQQQFPVGSGQSISFEATPYYLCHPLAMQRVSELLPDIRILVLLRNPVARAWSQYCFEKAHNNIKGTFKEATDCELNYFAGEEELLADESILYSMIHHRYSLLHRGLYYKQLLRLHRFIASENTLVLKSEDLFSNPSGTVEMVCKFLGLDAKSPSSHYHHNKATEPLKPDNRFIEMMQEFYYEPNRQLSDYIGITWDNE